MQESVVLYTGVLSSIAITIGLIVMIVSVSAGFKTGWLTPIHERDRKTAGDAQTAVVAWKVSCERCGAGAAFLHEEYTDTFKRNHPHPVEKTPLGPVMQNATDR